MPKPKIKVVGAGVFFEDVFFSCHFLVIFNRLGSNDTTYNLLIHIKEWQKYVSMVSYRWSAPPSRRSER